MNTAELRMVMAAAVLLLGACTANRITGTGSIDTSQSSRTGVLHLHATYTAPYCGGADPGTEGMPRPEPWSGPMYL